MHTCDGADNRQTQPVIDLSMGPGWISPKKAIKKVGQVLDVHRLAQVLNAENDPLPPKSFNTDLDLRPNLGVACCVSY